MFDKLTDRERKLALGVLALLPLALVFAVAIWIVGKLSDKDTELTRLQNQTTEARQLQLSLMRATKRRAVYLDESLPANLDVAPSAYSQWLTGLAQDKCQFQNFALRSQARNTPYRYQGRDPVYYQSTFVLTGAATLEQLTRFLFEFYQARILHRINSLTVTPRTTGTQGNLKLTNVLELNMSIAVISLPEAPADRDLAAEAPRALAMTLPQYQETIGRRNLFGLPNNTPQLSAMGTQSAESGSAVSFNIRATDNDEDDLLTFELLDPPIEGCCLTQADPSDRVARFECPGLEEGDYRFGVRVTDNGFPPKSHQSQFTVRVAEAVTPSVATRFEHAGQTYISAITRDESGQQVWIKVRTTGDLYRLHVGESFELDDQQWTIRKIEPPRVEILCDEERLVFHVGSKLSDPLKREPTTQPTVKRD